MAEVRSLLRQLVDQVKEKRLQPLGPTEATPPQPTNLGRRKKKRRGKGEEVAPTLFLGACSLLPAWEFDIEREGSPPAWEDVAAARLASFHPEKPPPLESYFYQPERLGQGGIRAVRDAIPRIPQALKGAVAGLPAPDLPAPDLPAAPAAAAAAVCEVPAAAPPAGHVSAPPAEMPPAGHVLAAPAEASPAGRTPEVPAEASPADHVTVAPAEASPCGYLISKIPSPQQVQESKASGDAPS
nr:tropomyosin-1, isoforms 33/34-like [Paramormyrops kingsleyae]